MKQIVLQSLILILSFGLIFIWQQTPLSDFTVPILGLLILVYLIVSFRKKEFNPSTLLRTGSQKGGNESGMAIFILNTLIFVLIFSTGTFASPLFFLLYFLGFGIAFVLNPTTVFVFILGTIAVFLPETLKDDVMSNALRLGSVALISPLAYFFGREFIDRSKEDEDFSRLENTTSKASETITADALEIEKEPLSPTQKEKIDDILEESAKLKEKA